MASYLWSFPSFRVSESAQTASTHAGSGSGHRVRAADGQGSLWFLLLRQSRQLFALAPVQVRAREILDFYFYTEIWL